MTFDVIAAGRTHSFTCLMMADKALYQAKAGVTALKLFFQRRPPQRCRKFHFSGYGYDNVRYGGSAHRRSGAPSNNDPRPFRVR